MDDETRRIVYEKIGEAPPEIERPGLLPENQPAWRIYEEVSVFNRFEHDRVYLDFGALKFLLDAYAPETIDRMEQYRKVILIHKTLTQRMQSGEHA